MSDETEGYGVVEYSTLHAYAGKVSMPILEYSQLIPTRLPTEYTPWVPIVLYACNY